ncbi:MAG TPA: hypothetical protein VFR13_06015 [Jiangellaceae bacterium]|nr:hypothetical protein [Jiangellaceae bacterium]
MAMKILISEQRDGAATEVAQRLGAAGHSLVYCHVPGSGDGACVALSDNGRCPLADTDVAVVVDARTDDTAFTDAEFGAVCALRHATPLVVVGPVPDRTVSPWRDADVRCETRDVVAACERAAAAVGATPHRAVAAAATRVIRRFGIDEQPKVVLRERHNVVDAFITTGRALPPSVREATRLAVRAGLAPYTKHWSYADVIFRS